MELVSKSNVLCCPTKCSHFLSLTSLGLSAATANVDYNSFSTPLTFSPSDTRQCTTVRILDDDIVEFDEVFNLRATTSSSNVVISNGGLSRVTIQDIDSKQSQMR